MRTFLWSIILLGGLVVLAGCSKKDEGPTGPGDGGGPGAGKARIEGSVQDASGNPVANAALHVIYELPGPALARQPATPSTAFFYNADQPLTTQCEGGTPLADGVVAKIYWDQNNNGVDDSDPLPPLCSQPPECLDGPPGTVNRNEFTLNGTASGVGPGLFVMESGFNTVGDVLTPNKFYVRIFCTDGRPLWTSQVVDVLPGYGEYELNFTCTQCEGAPEIPQWNLDPAYPNPAVDSVTVGYSLLETSPVLLTLTWPQREHVDTLYYAATEGAGTHRVKLALSDLPHELYNGLYSVRLTAGGYQADHALLYNVLSESRLRSAEPVTLAGSDGSFDFVTAAGVAIRRTNPDGTWGDLLQLNRVTVLAIMPGYTIGDTTFDVASGHTYNLTLRLISQ